MGDGRPVFDQEQLLARFDRFASLRAARRALEPSLRSPDELGDAELTQEIRRRLQLLKRKFQGRGDAGELAGPEEVQQVADDLREVDAGLERVASRLRQIAEGISLRQHRSVLPQLVREQPDEVLGLLELCAEDDAGLPNRMSLVEYLFTLLCIRRRNGVWSVVEEPTNLSTRIQRCCASAAESDLGETGEIVERFRSAAERLKGGEDIGAVIREMADYKASLAGRFFQPDVLRSILRYNVFVRNLREEEIRRERTMDREINLAVAAGKVEEGSAFESAALDAIEAALRARLSGAAATPGAASRIAARADTARLQRWEAAAFTNPEGADAEQCVRRCVALGLAAERDAEVGVAIAELGIDPDRLRRDWAREVGDRVQKEINHLIAVDSFEIAQRISETRNRHLYAPLSATIRERTQDMADRDTAPATSSAPLQDAPSAEPLAAPKPSRKAAARGEVAPRKRKSPRRKRQGSYGRMRQVFVTVVVAGLAAVAAFRYLAPDPRAARELSEIQLAAISTHLISGYRSERGQGTVFIGTVGPGWRQLDAEERRDAADQIQGGLATAGVRDIMLFDTGRALQARWAGGELRHLSNRSR